MKRRAARRRHRTLNDLWLRYEYKHTTIAIVALTLFIVLFDAAFFNGAIEYLKQQTYVGAFVAGLLSASFFTAAPAVILTIELATGPFDPLLLALIAGIGNAVGDMFLLLFFEERIFHELRPLLKKLGFVHKRRGRRKRMSAPMLLTGSFILMTPLPDEVGLGLLGISHFPKVFIFIICLALNTFGAAIVVLAARSFNG
ncbi:MAG TPA: hypothetical protein VLG40_02655 [Candidatus Saccharimonas sp.]|nr:hypothetical protein [Candidatus Saccharimonas sp.]